MGCVINAIQELNQSRELRTHSPDEETASWLYLLLFATLQKKDACRGLMQNKQVETTTKISIGGPRNK